MSAEQEGQIATIGKLLESEIRRQIAPQLGCWPLLVGVAGVVLGLILLAGRL